MSSFGKDEQFLKSNAAAMRALAGGKEHQVTYAGTDTHVGKDDVRLPALPPTSNSCRTPLVARRPKTHPLCMLTFT